MARDYEMGLIINPDVGDDQARAIVERVTTFVANNRGTVVRVNAWGRRHLAYPIEHHRDGLYFWFDLILPPEVIAELERTLRVNEDVMRHLLKVRDPRAVTQARQREAEAEAQAREREAEAAARAAAQAEAQAAQAAMATSVAVAEAPEVSEPSTEGSVEASTEPALEPALEPATEPTTADPAEEHEVAPTGAEAEV
jgi:small subunit ribosomal protein S6